MTFEDEPDYFESEGEEEQEEERSGSGPPPPVPKMEGDQVPAEGEASRGPSSADCR